MHTAKHCVWVLVIVASGALIAADTHDEPHTNPVAMLQTGGPESWAAAQSRILSERQNMITALEAVIEDPMNHRSRSGAVWSAIETMGSLRTVEGVDTLVKYIGFPVVKHPDAGEYPLDGDFNDLLDPIEKKYPAVPALIAIGEPVIPKVVAKLAESEHMAEQAACIAVLRRLAGTPSVQQQLEAAMRDAPDKQRNRLERALTKLAEE